MHRTRRRTLIALAGLHHGPARRDAPADNPTDGGAGGGSTDANGDGGSTGKPGEPAKPTFTGDFDAERAKSAIANAREGEKTAKAAQRAADEKLAKVMAALGKNPDGTDLDDPAAQAAELHDRASTAEAAAWRAGVRLAVHDVAGDAGASAKRLLDSMSFIDTLDDLIDDDPDSSDFHTALKSKIDAFVKANPDFKATGGQGPARMGAEHTGGSGGRQRAASLGEAVSAAYK